MKRIYAICYILISLVAGASVFIKMDELQTIHNIKNIEASYHTLLTVKALNENSSSDHFWLPSVTLSGDVNHNITWGATKPTASGSYIYTSFYTPAFLLATSFFNISGLDVNLINLSYLNFLLGFVTTLLVLTLFIKTKKIKKDTDISCATIVTNSSVRGYYNLLLNRNIHEGRTLEQALKLPRKKQCDLVYIEASGQPNDTVALHSYSIHKGK